MPRMIGVVLCNIGGPASGELHVVQAFLRRFFSDPAILPVNPVLRWMISKKIARRRGPESAKNYAMIGGRSPILHWTETQRRLLEEKLNSRGGGDRYRCAVAMRYAPPFTEDALALLDREGFRDIVSLPLYPHECCATTGSSLSKIDAVLEEMNFDRGIHYLKKIAEVRDFADDPVYLQSLAEKINNGLAKFKDRDGVHILFSAHGLPKRYIEQGDPYQKRIEASVAGLLHLLGNPKRYSLAYQSRVGPEKWLEPDVEKEIEHLAKSGVREMFVIPISFVSDHIETLHEIGMVYRERAMKLGMQQFEFMEGLNDSLTFISALEGIVMRAVQNAKSPANA
ncbi:MAG: ferrochelatase [Planctomycetota bacterium]